jgi:hypothetical protein
VRRRTFRRAAEAYRAGKPYKAWEILATAGMGEHWREFLKINQAAARQRFHAAMPAR